MALQQDDAAIAELVEDNTESLMTGHDDSASWAYGGAYLLDNRSLRPHQQRQGNQEATAKIFSDAHTDGVSASSSTALRQVELIADPSRAQPAFFSHGGDFPPVQPRPATMTASEDHAAALDLWAASRKAETDIILPVVSPTCSMAISANSGSAALRDLHHIMERERINRDVMDTRPSDLTQLCKKGIAGQASSAPDGLQKGADGADAREGEDEALLRRYIRLEEERLQGGALVAGADCERDLLDGGGEQAKDIEERKRHRVEKAAQLAARQRAIELAAPSEADEASYARIREQQQRLPIARCKAELLRCIGENAVTVVVGETGSGKTTQLVQYLHEAGYASGGQVIGCTQPRRLAAIGVARRVSEEMRCALGGTVGYAIHLDDTTSSATQIKFMTDGVLLRETVHDRDVSQYSVLILDEAHERSVDTDVLMGVLKRAISRRGDLKLLVTSATLDVQKFSRFFGNAPCYEVPGQTFAVKVQYAPSAVPDYVAEAVFRVCQLHLQSPLDGRHDVLVFMTGRDDVYGTCELIKRRLRELHPAQAATLVVLPCLSEASSLHDAAHAGDGSAASGLGVLDATPVGMRKCVVATNVAETSLTIDGVRFVVDCGFMKTNVFRPAIGMNTLQRYPVSQAQAGQRKGRAGRTAEGICFRLYTEVQFTHEMLASSVPEIQRSSVESVVLLLKSIGVERLVDFDFVDPPPQANVQNSMWHLWILGLLDEHGAITAVGRQTLEFPLAPLLGKLLVESAALGCSVEVLRIVAMLTADPRNLFDHPKGKEAEAHQHHSRFYANDSDHLTYLNLFSQFMSHGRSRQWAQDHYLHAPTLLRAGEVLQQLLERARRVHMPLTSCGAPGHDTVRYCLAKTLCLQAARRSVNNWSEYRPLLNPGVVCQVHPSSAVCARAEMPPYVVYNDLLFVTKEYLVVVTAVEPEWLQEGAPQLFYIKGKKPQSTLPTAATTTTTALAATASSRPPPPTAVSSDVKSSSTKPASSSAPPTFKFGQLSGKRRRNI